VRINEWSPNNDPNDFVELFNTAALPVDLGLAQVSTNNGTTSFSPFSFVDANAFALIGGDSSTGFNLRNRSGKIELLSAGNGSIDLVNYQVAGLGVAQGRSPDGSSRIAALRTPTPGSNNATPIETTLVSFQNGVSPNGYLGTQDTWIMGSDPNSNFGSQDRMDSDADASGSAEWSLLRWDLTSIDGVGLVQSATISLTVNNASADDQPIFAMKTDWNENEATWNSARTGQSWSAPGTGESDRGVLIGILSTGGQTGTHAVNLNLDGIAVVQSWLDDPSTNLGVIILGGNDGVELRTSEYSVSAQRPKLAIEYTDDVVRGDFNGSGAVDEQDITLLCQALQAGNDLRYDLNGDGLLSVSDRNEMIFNVLGTTYGDANLDGIFNSTDFVAIFQRGEYEDATPGNSVWSDGDWNCDGDFTTTDLVVAFQAGGYVREAQPGGASSILRSAAARRDVNEGPQPKVINRDQLDDQTATRASIRRSNRAVAILSADAVDSVFR
jgi:hypothetical protein